MGLYSWSMLYLNHIWGVDDIECQPAYGFNCQRTGCNPVSGRWNAGWNVKLAGRIQYCYAELLSGSGPGMEPSP